MVFILTLRRKYTSRHPKDVEQLRAEYDVISNLWLLAQMRQPKQALYTDLSLFTFPRVLKELFEQEELQPEERAPGPQKRRGTSLESLPFLRIRIEKGGVQGSQVTAVGSSAAWWSAYNSTEHRMLHWLQLVSLANTPASASSVDSQKLARLEREVAELRKDRSRTPRFLGRGRGNRPRALPNSQQLALPAPASSSTASGTKSHGKDRRGKDGQEGLCTEGAQCVGCGTTKPYNECHCLQPKIQNLP